MSNDYEDGFLMGVLDLFYFVFIFYEGGMIYFWKDYE